MNIYCLDTSVLLDNPAIILELGQEDDKIILPFCVVDELDGNKTASGRVGKHARDIIHSLDELRKQGGLKTGVLLETGVTFQVVDDAEGFRQNDQTILETAILHNNDNNVTLVTNDIAMRIKGDVRGLDVLGFEKPDQFTIYTGTKEIDTDSDVIDEFFKRGSMEIPDSILSNYNVCPNEMLLLKAGTQSALVKTSIDNVTTKWMMKSLEEHKPWGVIARNKEQDFALNLLMDKDIHMVSLIGRSGCGKSFLAVAAGVEQVIEKREYENLIIIRPIVPVGQEMGFLPGSVDEKLDPWLRPIRDSLDVLFSNKKINVDMMFEDGTFQMQALSYIRGRSIPNAYIIVDECQNMPLSDLKAVLTRAADGTKIVLTGDIEQIDRQRLDVINNGLSISIEKLKSYTLTGHITLVKGQRSPLATVCAEVL